MSILDSGAEEDRGSGEKVRKNWKKLGKVVIQGDELYLIDQSEAD